MSRFLADGLLRPAGCSPLFARAFDTPLGGRAAFYTADVRGGVQVRELIAFAGPAPDHANLLGAFDPGRAETARRSLAVAGVGAGCRCAGAPGDPRLNSVGDPDYRELAN